MGYWSERPGCRWASESCQTNRLLCTGWWERNTTSTGIWVLAQQKCARSFSKSFYVTFAMGNKIKYRSWCRSRVVLPSRGNGVSGNSVFSSITLFHLKIILVQKSSYFHSHVLIHNFWCRLSLEISNRLTFSWMRIGMQSCLILAWPD